VADLPTLPLTEKDLFKVVSVLRQTVEFLSRQPALMLGGWVANVNLNSANTDNAITILTPKANYYLHSVLVRNKGTTASITTATAGLFTAAGGGGAALAANQALSALTSNAVNTAGGLMFMTLSASNQWANRTTLYFRVGTAQGAAATADVYVFIQPLP
jgi:hypothetical protein